MQEKTLELRNYYSSTIFRRVEVNLKKKQSTGRTPQRVALTKRLSHRWTWRGNAALINRQGEKNSKRGWLSHGLALSRPRLISDKLKSTAL